MTYDPQSYEQRQAVNDRSRTWATRYKETWTPEDDAVLLQMWVYPGPEKRDEVAVSRSLSRTVETCRWRASFLLGIHRGVGYQKQPVRAEPPAKVCTGCWLTLPLSGECSTCG